MSNYRQRIYEKYARSYKNQGEMFNTRWADYLASQYRHYLRDWLPEDRDASIVDLACGNGDLLYMLKQQGYTRLTGVDISDDQLRIAQQIAADVRHADVLQFVSECESQFDVITGIDIIEHFTKDEVLSFLDGCYRALKPGGRLILQTPNADSPWVAQIHGGDFTHVECFSTAGLARVLQLCGFENIALRERGPVAVNLPSLARCTLWQLIRAGMKLWNKIEMGSPGSGVYTRIFLASAVKPANASTITQVFKAA